MIDMLLTVFGLSLVAIIIWHALPILAVMAGVAVVAWILLRIVNSIEARWEKRKKDRSDLINRAERQHQQLMDGDENGGVYGEYPPAV